MNCIKIIYHNVVSSLNTCIHFQNNIPPNKKTCLTIVVNLFIYLFTYTWNNFLRFIKTMYFLCSYIIKFLYMFKHAIKMFSKLKKNLIFINVYDFQQRYKGLYMLKKEKKYYEISSVLIKLFWCVFFHKSLKIHHKK